jgi:hypothetical protein
VKCFFSKLQKKRVFLSPSTCHFALALVMIPFIFSSLSCSSYKKKEKDKNEKFLHEKLEKLHNIFIKSNLRVDTAGDGHG